MKTTNPPQRHPGLEDSKIPAPYYCPACNRAVDAHYTAGGMSLHHTKCKTLVRANPEYVAWKESQTDDFSDLLEN